MKEALAKLDPELLFADGFDNCIVGITIGDEGVPVVMYSEPHVIAELEKEMSLAEACEYFDFNIAGAYMGPRTPMFVWIQ